MGRGDGRGGSDDCSQGMCMGSSAFILCAVGSILLGVSFDTVRPEEIAINYNTLTKQIRKDQVYTAGRFHLGIGHGFVNYPINIQNIEFSNGKKADAARLGVWSKDGQAIDISCSFMYQLLPQRTIDLFAKFGDAVESEPWKVLYIQSAQSVIKATTVQFTTLEFFQNRTDISELIFSQLRAEMWKSFAELKYFQLRTISIPAAFETSVIQKLTAKQAVKRGIYENEARLVTKNIDKVIRSAQAEKNKLLLTATASGTLIQQQAEALGKELIVRGQADAYESLKSNMGMSNPDLLYFKYLRTLRARKNTRLLVDTGSSVMLNKA